MAVAAHASCLSSARRRLLPTTRHTVALFPPRTRDTAAVVRLPKVRDPALWCAADWSAASGYWATDTRQARRQTVSHVRTRTPTWHHRHRLRIINVAMQCTNHGRATAIQMTVSNCAGRPRLFAACMHNARLASPATLLFIPIIFPLVINAHKYFGKSHARICILCEINDQTANEIDI